MKKKKPPTGYLPALAAHIRSTAFAPGQVHHIEVRHDDACAIWKTNSCDCAPVVVSGEGVNRKYGQNGGTKG